MLLPAEPTFIKEFLESPFNQWTETCSVQSELCSSALIYILTDESEQPYNRPFGTVTT